MRGLAVLVVLACSPAAAQTGGEIYRERCASCHDAGTNGAPRPGIVDDWRARAERGRPALIRNAMRKAPHTGGADPATVAAVDFMLSTVDILVNSYSAPPRLESGK